LTIDMAYICCHAGQQRTTRFNSADKLPNTKGAKLLTIHSGTPGRHPVSNHQMAPPKRGSTHPITALLLIYRPRKDERLIWPSWLSCSGRFTHIKWSPVSCRSSEGQRNTDKTELF